MHRALYHFDVNSNIYQNDACKIQVCIKRTLRFSDEFDTRYFPKGLIKHK